MVWKIFHEEFYFKTLYIVKGAKERGQIFSESSMRGIKPTALKTEVCVIIVSQDGILFKNL